MTGKYFTKEEIESIKNGSIHFPSFFYDGINTDNIISVWEVVAVSGMASNNGIPNEITIYQKTKGKETKKLTYKLV
jgi:hypothetical protein